MIGEERNLRRGNRRRMRALLTKENPAGGHDPPSSHQITRMRKYPLARTNQQGPKREDVSGADSCWFSWDKENGRFLHLLLINNLCGPTHHQRLCSGEEQMLCCIDNRSTIPSRYRRILADSVLHWYEFPPPGVRLLLLSLFCQDHVILANNRCPFDWEDFHADCVGNEPSLNLQYAAKQTKN